jgi:hypothetical protein
MRRHRQKQHAELTSTDKHTVGCEITQRHRWSTQEERNRKESGTEAKRRKQQWRQVIETDTDHDEIRAPHGHHGEREQGMAKSQGGVLHRQSPLRFLRGKNKNARV